MKCPRKHTQNWMRTTYVHFSRAVAPALITWLFSHVSRKPCHAQTGSTVTFTLCYFF